MSISRFFDIRDAQQFDAVFVQRPLVNDRFYFLEKYLLSLNKNIIFDFDDAFFYNFDGTLNSFVLRYAQYVLTRAQKIVVGNSYLADFARTYSDDITVIPTCIDTGKYVPIRYKTSNRKGTRITIGWMGTSVNYPFLNTLEKVFIEIKARYPGVDLRVVSEQAPPKNLPVEYKRWSVETEISDLQSFDIGIMPLDDNPWSRGKCGFKLLQYMACGVPVVASPVGINSEIVAHGVNGYLAEGVDEWIRSLSSLVEGAQLRQDFGKRGRQNIKEEYDIKVYQDEFVNVLQLCE